MAIFNVNILKSVIKFFSKNYIVFLLLVVGISYGQMLEMYIWKDDNAIFFKFDHLGEPAGYLGRGLLGEGPYKFSVMPYWFVYKIFGNESITPYYVLTFFFYFLSTVVLYIFLSKFATKKVAKVGSFLFASGYIASEGFLWLASSMIQSVSIILTLLTLLSYYFYSKDKKAYLFITTLGLYIFTSFLTPVRTHYLIALLIIFDALFVVGKFSLKEIRNFILRITVLSLVFYYFFVNNADHRTFTFSIYLKDIFSGNLYQLYSFFGTISNLFLPDRQLALIQPIYRSLHISSPLLSQLGISIISLSIICLYTFKKSKVPIFIAFILTGLWFIISRLIYTSPQASQDLTSITAVFVGGIILITLLVIAIAADKISRKKIIFFAFWVLTNLFAYTSYLPTSIYPSFDRYLAHSFVPIAGLLAYLAMYKFAKAATFIVVFLGVLNIYNSVTYQNKIVNERSIPAKTFYQDLKKHLPEIKQGDVLYFDVADSARNYYASAFSVGQMPETTAIAWRYGIDRYDLQMFTDFDILEKTLEKEDMEPDRVHSFFYSKDGLINTTQELREKLTNPTTGTIKIASQSEIKSPGGVVQELHINFEQPISGVVPQELTMKARASILDSSLLTFPFQGTGTVVPEIAKDEEKIKLAFGYKQEKFNISKSSEYLSSSNWQDRVIDNIHDNNLDTVWQPDRILWGEGKEHIIIDLKSVKQINKFVWINGFANNTPTQVSIEVSLDGNIWKQVKQVNYQSRIDTKEAQVIEFDSQEARFIKANFVDSLNDDSPGIAEAWVVPAMFSNLNIVLAEKYLQNTFTLIPSREIWEAVLAAKEFKGKVQYAWMSDKSDNWITGGSSQLELNYDGRQYFYNIYLPASGTKISKLKLFNTEIPGTISVESISAKSKINFKNE